MKRLKLYALAGVALVAAAGGTFAYYNSVQTFSNPFDTTNYSTYVTEKFNPGDGHEWKPGAKVTKEVYASNTGEGDVWVRVKFDEVWKRNGKELTGTKWNSGDATFNPDNADKAGETVQPGTEDGEYVGDKDGITANDTGSVVFKEFVNVTEAPESTQGEWYLKDGYYYYTSALEEKQSTNALLKSVQLCGDADMGKFNEVNAYIIVPKLEEGENPPEYDKEYKGNQWINGTLDYDFSLQPGDEGYNSKMVEKCKGKDIFTYKANELDEKNQGYANAGYELNITIEIVQADEEGKAAEEAKWSWYPGKTAADTTP